MTCKWTLLRKTCNSYSGTVPRELPVSSKQETKGKSRRVTTTRRRTHTRAAAACTTSAEETESMRQQRINVLHLPNCKDPPLPVFRAAPRQHLFTDSCAKLTCQSFTALLKRSYAQTGAGCWLETLFSCQYTNNALFFSAT